MGCCCSSPSLSPPVVDSASREEQKSGDSPGLRRIREGLISIETPSSNDVGLPRSSRVSRTSRTSLSSFASRVSAASRTSLGEHLRRSDLKRVDQAPVPSSRTAPCGMAVDQPQREQPQSTLYPCVAFTHEGGHGSRSKENQDSYFVVQATPTVFMCGVLDGHGKKHGLLAARIAASKIRAHLCASADELHIKPRQVLKNAFEAAHLAVRQAICRFGAHNGTTRLFDPGDGLGPIVLEWLAIDEDEPEGEHAWEAADGGTTATIVVVLSAGDERRLFIAAVGDSTGAMVSSSGENFPLVPEHEPASVAEYARLCQASKARGSMPPQVIYDCQPTVPVFRAGAEIATHPDPEFLKQADEARVGIKNAAGVMAQTAAKLTILYQSANPSYFHPYYAGERCTLLVIPSETFKLPATPTCATASVRIEEQNMAMTRSIGDFFTHRHGIVCSPEIVEYSLQASAGTSQAVLSLASDGIWDLMSLSEVSEILWPGDNSNATLGGLTDAGGHLETYGFASELLRDRVDTLAETVRERGADWFGESADNLTGLVIDLGSTKVSVVQEEERVPKTRNSALRDEEEMTISSTGR